MHRKIPTLQIEMQVLFALNFRYFTCLLDKGHISPEGIFNVKKLQLKEHHKETCRNISLAFCNRHNQETKHRNGDHQ